MICVPTLVTKAKDQDLGPGHEWCTKRGGESERRSNRSSGVHSISWCNKRDRRAYP